MGKSVSLVLGSGAARGLAHIGVIEVLQRHDLEIKSISGTSMGALIGGLYAAGGLEEFTEFARAFRKVDFFKYLDLSPFGSAGWVKGDIIIDTLKDIVGDIRIDELPIPYTAVAADINTGREVWLQKGRLFDAIRASIAIPGVFTPHRINGRMLVDGGIVNPVPVMPGSDTSTDLTIAVDVNGHEAETPHHPEYHKKKPVPDYQKKVEKFFEAVQKRFDIDVSKNSKSEPPGNELSLSDILLRSFTTMQATLTRYKLAANQPDILISIPRNICEVHEFYKAELAIDTGIWWTERALETAKLYNHQHESS